MDDSSQSESASQPRSWLDRLSQLLGGEPRNREDLIEILETARERGLLDATAFAMMEGVLELHDLRARDIMIPRCQMDVIEQDASFADILRQVLTSGHSRYPVIGENRDEVVGILLVKDLLHAIPLETNGEGQASFDITAHLRPVLFVPESKRVDALLAELRASRNHMTVVIDEYGGVAGLITIEDILEQIVGNIEDEYDVEEDVYIRAAGSDRYIVHALTPIDEFNEYVGANLPDTDFDTVGGLVTHILGHLPHRDERIVLDGFEFRVISADSRRLHRLRVTRMAPGTPAEET
ncbi:MAG: transporter associated domain-containing protein [Halothiobacillaceae bacterium]